MQDLIIFMEENFDEFVKYLEKLGMTENEALKEAEKQLKKLEDEFGDG